MSDTPRTEAGRALLGLTAYFPFEPGDTFVGRRDRVRDHILAIEAEAAATSSPAGNGEPQKCSDCGPYAPCPKHDEGTRDAAPELPDGRLLGWRNPDVRQAAREKIEGAVNLSQAFARSLLDALDAAIEAATPPSEAPSGGLDPATFRQLAQALSCWSSIGEGDPEFMPWAEQMIRAYLSPTPGQGDGLDVAVTIVALEAMLHDTTPGASERLQAWLDRMNAALATPAPDPEP